MIFLRLMFAQLFQYNHKQLQFITALYTVQFVNMCLETFDLVAGLEKLLHLACLMKCYIVILVRNRQKP